MTSFNKHYLYFYFIVLFCSAPFSYSVENHNQPNIVWLFIEDTNDWMGCYGDNTVPTPNIDALAQAGTRFDRAYMPAGVCSATRSALAFGCMQTTLGIHHHRSSRKHIPEEVTKVPAPYKTVYKMFRESGYYVINDGPKNDFNFEWPTQSPIQMKRMKGPYGTGAYMTENKQELFYDINTERFAGTDQKAVWQNRPKDKPVFIQFQLKGGKNSGNYKGVKALSRNSKETHLDQSKVSVMPYYPDIPSIRKEIAHHYDTIRQLDEEIGTIVSMLKKDNLYDNTIFFLFSDHGMKLYRHKQWLYEGGIKVPFIAWGPGIPKGKVRKDLVNGIDITATSLSLANIKVPK
ncbi:MAG: sulfatase-like hydrolase/transferase [Lentisphaeraceae bacterium]|nr:sulfatase-like hydrolase/transferase [Lentisphaeraceae bacterium]